MGDEEGEALIADGAQSGFHLYKPASVLAAQIPTTQHFRANEPARSDFNMNWSPSHAFLARRKVGNHWQSPSAPSSLHQRSGKVKCVSSAHVSTSAFEAFRAGVRGHNSP